MPDFPKSARLRQSQEFKRTLDGGRKVVCARMILFGRLREPDEPQDGLRLGLIVSKKVGESVERNRVKRQLREGFRHMAQDVAEAAGQLDLVVIARHGAAEIEGKVLQAELQSCFKRLLKRTAEGSR